MICAFSTRGERKKRIRSRDSYCEASLSVASLFVAAHGQELGELGNVKKLTQFNLNGRWTHGYLLTQLGAPQLLEKTTFGQLLGKTIVEELG